MAEIKPSFLPPRARQPGRFRSVMRRIWYGSTVYALLLKRRAPKGQPLDLPDPWPGNAEAGRAIIGEDHLFFQADGSPSTHVPAFAALAGGPCFAGDPGAALHSFVWLSDVAALAQSSRAAGDEETAAQAGRAAARAVGSWLMAYGRRWHPLAWRPDTIGARVGSWLRNRQLIGQLPAQIQPDLATSLARQAHHLANALHSVDGIARLKAIKGLALYGLAFGTPRQGLEAAGAAGGDSALYFRRAMALLERELDRQILADGGHVSRSPLLLLAAVMDLVEIRSALDFHGQTIPERLQRALDRMAPMVRFFRHGDGGLALFNGSRERPEHLDLALSVADLQGKPLQDARYSGFQRLHSGKTLVIADCGPPAGLDTVWSHAGTLSYEMSWGRERLIVNCGGNPSLAPDWRRGLRATAAHSTLTLDETNSSEIGPEGFLKRRPKRLFVSREDADGAQWLDMSHDGYEANFGAVHRRRLYLGAGGDDLRGEDSVSGAAGRSFQIRFHLHPDVQVSAVQTGNGAFLKTGSGAGWRFQAAGAVLSLAESVYWGQGKIQRSEQICLTGIVPKEGAQVKWAFTLVGKK